nr:PREDICTED: hyaluronidase PH-20-like [Lepisosteus oculatus]
MDLLIQKRKNRHLFFTLLYLALLENLGSTQHIPPTAGPLFNGYPFVAVWNAPINICENNQVTLDFAPFAAVTTPQKIKDQELTLFYSDRLGLYPNVNETTKQEFYGGIPQKGDSAAHLKKAKNDIAYYIPSTASPGLAVIDWEAWRPLWDRNWNSKAIYRTLSIIYTKQLNDSLSPQQTIAEAKEQFQTAARNYMADTLALGLKDRPQELWGYYLFPNCYNYEYKDVSKPYTGKCSPQVQSQNDQLIWLWEKSTALYPSVYLSTLLKESYKAALFVRNCVQEAMRVAALPKHSFTAPVYVYNRPVFVDSNKQFLNENDLINTIGESAAVGASGVILWGASADYDDKASCEALSRYLPSTLNPYIVNVTAAAKLCSDMLCQGNGRCVRKNYDSNDYLHLNPANFKIQRGSNGKYFAVGMTSSADLTIFMNKFTCRCYAGKSCKANLPASFPQTPTVINI